MATKASFTEDEWIPVLGGVFMAGFAVTAADPSGLWGLLKETFASGRALMEAKTSPNASGLSKAVVSDIETSEGRSAAQEFVKGRLRGAKREEIKQRAIDALRSAAAIVDQKAPSDAAAYRAWLLYIANNVAEASKEEDSSASAALPSVKRKKPPLPKSLRLLVRESDDAKKYKCLPQAVAAFHAHHQSWRGCCRLGGRRRYCAPPCAAGRAVLSPP